jgi:hypothetical protein
MIVANNSEVILFSYLIYQGLTGGLTISEAEGGSIFSFEYLINLSS